MEYQKTPSLVETSGGSTVDSKRVLLASPMNSKVSASNINRSNRIQKYTYKHAEK